MSASACFPSFSFGAAMPGLLFPLLHTHNEDVVGDKAYIGLQWDVGHVPRA